ncbi:hypothetical protein QJQ45_007484 [Haematococcus lacustris]|nr:hypothetical protein QJQ45_007484 [Haematococcus lacustris]
MSPEPVTRDGGGQGTLAGWVASSLSRCWNPLGDIRGLPVKTDQAAAEPQHQLEMKQKEIYLLKEQLSAANAAGEDMLADMHMTKAQAADLQQHLAREREEMEMMEERLSAANAAEEGMLADMRAIKEQLACAQSQLALTTTSSSSGHDDGTGRDQAQPQPPAVRGSGGSSFPMGFGCVEQRECLDQLSVAVEQLADAMVWEDNLHSDVTRHLVTELKNLIPGSDLLTSDWCRHTCSIALHSYIMEEAVACVQYQQQTIWFQSDYDLCLASCPESGRTDLQAAMQQLQQAKSSTLFLVAQQQAPSHPATREAAEYVEGIRQSMQLRLEQQLGLNKDIEAGKVWQPQLMAVAAAMTRVNLLLAGLQGSCPGLQLVSSLEDWAAPEGQRACEAPVRQLLGKVQSSRPLFLVRPGLVCPAAGGGRQVLVRQQLVELVPDPTWQQRLKQLEQQPAFLETLVECDEPKPPALPGVPQSGADLARSKAPAGYTAASMPLTASEGSSDGCVQQLTSFSTSTACCMVDSSSNRGMSDAAEQQLAAYLDSVGREVQKLVDNLVLGWSPLPEVMQQLCSTQTHPDSSPEGHREHCWLLCHVFMLNVAMRHMQPPHPMAHTAMALAGTGPEKARVEVVWGREAWLGVGVEAGVGSSPSGSPGGSHAALDSATAAMQQHLAEELGLGPSDRSWWKPQLLTVAAAIAATLLAARPKR